MDDDLKWGLPLLASSKGDEGGLCFAKWERPLIETDDLY